ncbi:hypothetical protein AVEN_149037-1 [Araneus ventricosus]|uniref:Uncharacterized protein n=1 Tax=Araneus ventricosus TaxID=182803 RepID=A0A4Y2UP23_ARAVE|nr:hypothetical protein AVEN_149037-1 [Araneus ventricosus]
MSRYKPKLDHYSLVWSGSLENGVTTHLFSSLVNIQNYEDNKKVTVTIDRLKPAHLLLDNVNSSESTLDSPGADTPSPTPSAKEPEKSAMPLPEKSPILTRTGRRVHFPVKYRDFVS